MQFQFNSIYKPVFNSTERYIDIWGGRGRGGSHFVTDYFLHKITCNEYFRGYFMRSVLNDVRESLFRDFKDRLEEKDDLINQDDFHIDENKMVIVYKPTGNIIISKGFKKSSGSQTAKLKSIAGATHVAIEECEEISEDDFNTLNVSLRTVKATPQIFRIFNPPEKSHWLIKNDYDLLPAPDAEDYFVATAKKNDQLLSVFSTYTNNLKNLDKVFVQMLENFKNSNPDYYYSNVKGYVSSGRKGQIFKNYQFFDELPDKRFYTVFGMDYGYEPDPTVLVELNINIEQKELYIREWHRELKMSIEDIYTMITKNNPDRHEVICDNAEKREYNALMAYGLNIMRSAKGGGSRKGSRELIKNFKMFIHKDSKDYHKELENHTWALDAQKNPTGKPIDGWDHGIDATCYGLSYYVKYFGLT
jgi:phage terminase large subunit